MHDRIVELARQAHKKHWQMSGDEGTGDRLAKTITDEWQEYVRRGEPDRFEVEVPISENLRERIDLVDMKSGVAYELKVSPNNAHFEFYRDIFKVMIARDLRLPQLNRFVFLVPAASAKKLLASMGGVVVQVAPKLGIVIEVVGI